MKNNINKEEWIDQVLESTRDMTEAKLPHDLYEQITNKLSAPTKPKTVPNTAKQWIAAAIILLAINAGSAIYYVRESKKTAAVVSSNPIALEIKTESTYNY